MIKNGFRFSSLLILVLFSSGFFSPVNGRNTGIILKGAGATFPHPLYADWIKIYKDATGVRISYQAVGSGGGIKALLNREVDFGATDAFLSDQELVEMGGNILHIPTCLGAVVISYNLPGKPELKLTPTLAADIFSGTITQWSDKRIQEVNQELRLPDLKISVVHRSDSSGTTFIFTNYLAVVNAHWRENIGTGKLIRWPVGVGLERNPGVAEFVKQIPGAAGYVELTYAVDENLPTALVKNRQGKFIQPTLKSVNFAARVELPADTRALIIDTTAADGYPISAFTWIIFYKEQSYDNRPLSRAKTLARFLWWAIHEGQTYSNKNHYTALPEGAIHKAESIIRAMTFKGEPVVDW